jgi:hypothetical protein
VTLLDDADADADASTGARACSLSVFSLSSVSFRNGGGRVVVIRRDDGKGGVCEDSWTKDDDEE